jgi:arylsulfatase A-like enzyme
MRRTLFTLACWFLLAPIAAQKDVSAAPNKTLRPNILIILTDDMGYGDVAILNRGSRIPTPNLDRLAKEGLIFTDAHSSGSYCVPSRYGLLTGRYMWRTRLGSGGS